MKDDPAARGGAGVWFFSLDAASPLAVRGARWLYHLPYFNADMSRVTEAGTVRYSSHRTHRGAPAAHFRARYRPTGPPTVAAPGSLADWLTARFSLYAADRRGRIYRADIAHIPWPLQPAEAEITVNTMAAAAGIRLPAVPPLLHFARRVTVQTWWRYQVLP
jgi:uncharacterized protein YqjF (DUF2071 family)